ncbi:p26 [Helicoverpa armigera multiple nucleopolyhedrovirus]|uniref:p26 n=2 Tax=Alphabaculovirus TaxID=558016 RepID=J7H7I7_NPVMB|nr:putative P26 [Mamestra configurata nucleopolyhedrovirus B]ACH88623.1 p26 [Helicoverpa armigera multiple nucleopolyhedrovirus]AFP95820.2 p26 [Mamestra brassicae multiple nucleopolyhedrovirus]WNA17481.1 p26 [Alphabaculovirus mabrassicae]AAM95095.1 putative P26 [Mamestra configurata nucleopolyhedrovirus B]AIL25179.1 p26 [Mamestra brassicae multiple nucleopolyhedrovirus]
MSSSIKTDDESGRANVVEQMKHVTYSVNHLVRRVNIISSADRDVRVHVFGQHDVAPEFETIKYHYPNVASDWKFPRLQRNTYINVLLFNSMHKAYLRRMKLQDKLYYVHHHYAKYYVYGQVPAVLQKTDISEFMQQLYVSAPIFDDAGHLVSVVSDYYVDNNNQCVLPITGEGNGVQGTFSIDGFVYVTDPEDFLTRHIIQIVPRIDVYVTFDKKNVFINLLYNGVTLSKLRIRTQFAANVLIL